MKSLTLFSDPHLGTSRAAHTTPTSSNALKQRLYEQAMHIVKYDDTTKICLGDLFDKAFNQESVLVQGYNVASECWSTLSGNHDETNREGTVTSLRALQAMDVRICSAPDLSNPYFDCFESIYMVPHHASQALFERAMREAAAHAAQHREGLASYLMLHCNYNFSLAIEDNTLNLSAELAQELISSFDYIFIGHEHVPSRHLGGQVIVMGNTHPTSFADISDKFVYSLELDTATLTTRQVWSVKRQYLQIPYGSDIPDLSGVEFVDVTGVEGVASAVEINDFIREIWAQGEQLFAVRNKVALKDALDNVDSDVGEVVVVDLKTRIRNELSGTELEVLFNELVQQVEA